MYQAKLSGKAAWTSQQKTWVALGIGLITGYILGMVIMETADIMFTTGAEQHYAESHGLSQQALSTTIQQTSALQQSITTGTQASGKPGGDTIHTLLTSNGSPYQNFQGRIMYGTYKLVQKMPGGEKLTGFTRIMHRMTDDEVMDEIPTFRATPLHPKCDVYCDFPVADRPNAVRQWIEAADKDPTMIKGAWLFLVECDYVWIKPFQAPNAFNNEPGLQFHFDYINPDYPGIPDILKRLATAAGLEVKGAVPPSGPAPALLRFDELKAVTPAWEAVTAAIEADAQAVKVLGWVREMYAWDLAIAAKGINIKTEDAGVSPLMIQPPHDTKIGPASICHYTWGAIYSNMQGQQVYKWEKREYTAAIHALKVPHIPMPPQPFQPDTWKLQDGLPVTRELHETLTIMLGQMNKAIDTLPDLSSRSKPA